MTTFYYGLIDKTEPASEEYYFEFHCLLQQTVNGNIYKPVKSFHSLIKELPDPQWFSVMDYPKELYQKEVIEKFQKEIAERVE